MNIKRSISLLLTAAIATPTPLLAQQPETAGTGAQKDKTGSFVSKKSKMRFADAATEDITDENFPDLIESFDYPNADIADIIKAISELTGRNFIVDPQVRGKITIIAPSQITVAEAYRAFLSALATNGMTVVPYGKFWKIKQSRAAQRDSIETYSGAYFPNSDQMITKIIKLKYISAEEVNKNLRILPSKDGEMVPYPATNSIIISDYGSNIERVMKIINQLDVPGFEEQMEVIRIRYAKSKEIADLIMKIINKGEGGSGFSGGVPRFRRAGTDTQGATSGAESYDLVIGDDRTNSIIVVGNKAGIEKIRRLVNQLDFRLRPDEAGGVYVYYVRHGEAETIANTLNGIASESKKAQAQPVGSTGAAPPAGAPIGPSPAAIFGGDVKVTADKATNSLIITASRQDYELLKNILGKIDISRDQVFVKTIIMEMRVDQRTRWGIDLYRFDKGSGGIGRIGFRGSDDITSLLSPAGDKGLIFGFGSGDQFDLTGPGGASVKVTELVGLVNFLKQNAGANILSTPQVMALDNEKAIIEVGENVPVGTTNATGANGITTSGVERKDVTIKLELTPYISPDTESVQMKINQKVAQLSNTQVKAAELAKQAIITTTRNIETQIVVNSGDTAVLGGLMADQENESVTKVPVLGDIPIIGWLFKSKTVEKSKANLLVFITPKIVRNAEDSAGVLNSKLNERIDFIQRSMSGRDPHGEIIDQLPRKALSEESMDRNTEEPAVESF